MSNGWHAIYNDFGATWGKAVGAVGIAIYQSLASRAWDGQCFPSYQTIADDTGVSRPTAIKYIKKLQDVGLIEVQPRFNRRGDPTSNLYTLTNLPLLKKKNEAPVKPTFEEIDTSGLSEEEIAELKRKSLFLPRSKKKSQKSVPAPSETSSVPAPVEKKIEATVRVSEPPPIVIQQETSAPQPFVVQQQSTVSEPEPTSAPTVIRREERVNLGEFGKISPEKDIINAYHILKGVPNKQEVIDELNKAILEGRIQSTPIKYLYGLVKKVEQGEFVPTAHKKTEEELFREEKQRADEKEKKRKQAIVECPRCNNVGHLVYSAIQPFDPKIMICTHDEKADEFIAYKKAEEARGETICYFGKGKPLDKEEAKRALEAIRGTVSTMTGKTPETIPLTPESDPIEVEQQREVVTSPVDEIQSTPTSEPQKGQPKAKKRGGGFKRIGELTDSIATKFVTPEAEPPKEEAAVTVEHTVEQEVKSVVNEVPKENVAPTPVQEKREVTQEIIPDPVAPELLKSFGRYSEEHTQRLLSLTTKLPEPTGERLLRNGQPMSMLAEKVAIVKDELERLYRYEEVIVEKQILKHLEVQSTVRAARLRALVNRDANNPDSCQPEETRTQALRAANILQAAAPIMLTVTHARKNRLILDYFIEAFEAPYQDQLGEPPQEIMSQRLLDNLQELDIVKTNLAIQLDLKQQKQSKAVTADQIDKYHKEVRHDKQYQLICLIQDEINGTKGNLVAANEHMPPEWKCTPQELRWIEYRTRGIKSF